VYIVNNAEELAGLTGLTLEEQLKTSELDIKVINNHQRENYYRYGHLLIGHFNKVNKNSGYTAKNLVEEKGMSLIQAHTHRGGVSYKTDFQDVKKGIENFCLCNLQPPYLMIPNWQHGFSVIHTYKKTGLFKVTEMEIVQYNLMYGDKVFKAGR
jgi:hypothetical protein